MWLLALVLLVVFGVAEVVYGLGPRAAAETLTQTAASQTLVTTFSPEADAQVREASPAKNFGSSGSLRVDGASDPDVESYLRFTVSGLTGPVQRGTLRLFAFTGTSDGPAVYGAGNSWSESGITWSNRSARTTAAVADKGAIAKNSWVEYDVTSLVSGDGTFTFVLVATSTDGVDFYSRNSTQTSLRPELVVEASTSNAPVATSRPTISGAAQEGRTLTGLPGAWSGSQPMSFAYQWQRCDSLGAACADIPGASGQTYALASADVGATLRVVVTATNSDGFGTATSAATGVVIGAGDVVVTAAGDIADCLLDSGEATARLLDTIAPSKILTLGDNAYPDGTAQQFTDCYGPTWGRHKPKTSPSAGNHDYHTLGASGYFGYFGEAAGDPAKGYYAFDLGAWRLYALNSNCADVPCAAGSAQEQWLRADLAANPRSCVAAFMHHPRFASGTTNDRRDNTSVASLYQAFYQASGDLWLVGHNHNYERLTRLDPSGAIDLQRGIRNFVVGTGGETLGVFGTPTTGSEIRSMTHGVLKLTLRATGYDWEFVPVAGSTFSDSGSDTCNAAPADSTAPSAPAGLTATAGGAGRVDLSWTASTDNFGVVAYDVYRDAQLIATTTATGYSDLSGVVGTTYAYYVTARDAAGNVSGPSNTATLTLTASSTLVFSPDADARVHEATPTTNYGAASSLRVDGAADPDVESYLRFTVSGLTGPVQRATLRLYAFTATSDGPAVYGAGNDWTELGITWSTRPALTTAALEDKGAIASGSWVEFDVTSLVSGNGTFTCALLPTSSNGVDFYSRESTQTSLRPELVVTS